jgi:CRP-like cAMP-binding protein
MSLGTLEPFWVGRPYSLTAAYLTDCEVAHVGKRKFVELMTRRPALCREATDILSREMAFILSAFGQRPYRKRANKRAKAFEVRSTEKIT